MSDCRALLEQVPALQHPCDIDLVVFFARHPRALMSSEQLARLLGYPLDDVVRSLDALQAAGFLTQAQQPPRQARLYVFSSDALDGGPLAAIVELAATCEGRSKLRLALSHSPAGTGA